ncbi:YqaE/Pmp3 family membrane protein [Psychromonas sp. RZ22]|uniref:YqaE/Pmp3 family membrane protein n=1 Tax=Psychromonas algarum TaxID=2555643 RepID=UPI001068422F|nr:YqaE/Pmp3 family membrane protein [Psychromonas sp. RZ22]TEW55558.1 YqaE/Pmp3 family membrane protein [Psychromonas sp. RZ22]
MNQLLNIIICILLPPLAVLIKYGLGKDFIINFVLSLFFFVPGIIHALWLTTQK